MEESLKWSKRRVLLLYTALFLVLTAGVFGRFIYYGKSLIGGADGLSQVGASMVYNGKYYREFFGRDVICGLRFIFGGRIYYCCLLAVIL